MLIVILPIHTGNSDTWKIILLYTKPIRLGETRRDGRTTTYSPGRIKVLASGSYCLSLFIGGNLSMVFSLLVTWLHLGYCVRSGSGRASSWNHHAGCMWQLRALASTRPPHYLRIRPNLPMLYQDVAGPRRGATWWLPLGKLLQ